MKSVYSFALFLCFSLFLASCDDNVTDMGTSIQPDSDKITVQTDTFHLVTENDFVKKIYQHPDSFLLGTFKSTKYGRTHAEILAQVQAPFEPGAFRFPENAKLDSAVLSLSYRTWFGDESSTMSVNVYRMNQGDIFSFSEYYPSNLDPMAYADTTKVGAKLGERVFTAKDATGTKDSTGISITLNEAFGKELFEIAKNYTDSKNFLKLFRGFYITSNFGDATMIYISRSGIRLYLYYHYDTQVEEETITFKNAITFPANSEVTQVNCFQHPDTTEIKNYLELHDSINYISSPANIYTRVNLPVKRMVERMLQNMKDSIGDAALNKYLSINNATIRVDVKDYDTSTLALPVPKSLMLIPESDVDKFFSRDLLPNDSILYSDLRTDTCYTFNAGRYITNEIRKVKDASGKINTENLPDNLKLLLVPVRITATYDSYGNRSITSVKQQILMSGVTIRSGKGEDVDKRMKISVVYSGF